MAESMNVNDVLGDDFGGVDTNVKKSNGFPWEDARYRLRLGRCVLEPSENPDTYGQPLFKADFEVVQSTTETVPIGAERRWVCNTEKKVGKDNVGKPELKAFAAACYGLVPGTEEANKNIHNAHIQALLDGVQMQEGNEVLVDLVTQPHKAKKPPHNPWTSYAFMPEGAED